ncbi:MAG: FHA domain-containing protein [Blastocatellia bacterium]
MAIILVAGGAEDAAPEQRTEYIFDDPVISAGAAAGAQLPMNGPGVAAEQFVVLAEQGQYWLINRAGGTLLNGKPLPREARRLLADGDTLQCGAHVIRVRLRDAAETDETPATTAAAPDPSPDTGADKSPDHDTGHSGAGTAAATAVAWAQAEQPVPRHSFADILRQARTLENSYSFMIRGGPQDGLSLLLTEDEMQIGWDAAGRELVFQDSEIAAPCLYVWKTWHGVFVRIAGAGELVVDGDTAQEELILRHGDEIDIGAPPATETEEKPEHVSLVFLEPASLLLIEKAAPEGLPAPVTMAAAAPEHAEALPAQDIAPEAESTISPAEAPENAGEAAVSAPAMTAAAGSRHYLGYFSALELLAMGACTLAMTLIFYLLLRYVQAGL